MNRSQTEELANKRQAPLLLAMAALGICGLLACKVDTSVPLPPSVAVAPTLSNVLLMKFNDVSGRDIAWLNLACTEGFPEASGLSVQTCLVTLDQWSKRIQSEATRHSYRFRQNPAEFDRSEGFFRLLMMAVVLAEDFHVRYNPARASTPDQASTKDGFFADPQDVFLHGLLGPQRMGTCSSMPVLYVALGRRLGYPLKLVTTKGHLFVRWEDAKERFNVEVTGMGVNKFDDAYYRQWPFPVTDEEVQAEGYLKSLTPDEELAVFLSIRGMCLREANRTAEAAEAFAAAVRHAPNVRGYRVMLASLERTLAASPQASQKAFAVPKSTK